MWTYNYSTDVIHDGIKGQKWGVRRGPPYPIEDTVLKKGTKVNSISYWNDSEKYKNRKDIPMYTYRDDEEWDNKVYKGPFAYYKMKVGQAYVDEHKFETVKDLTMPTSKERIDEFERIYNTDKEKYSKDLSYFQKILKDNNVGKDNILKLDVNNLQTKEDYKNAYEIFNHGMEAAHRFSLTKEYVKSMSSKYDAMVDDNNVNRYNNAKDPIIIFRTDKVLKTIGNSKMLSFKEVFDNYDDVEKVLNAEGKNIKL